MNGLLRFLDVQPEEKGLAGRLFAFSFLIGTARFFVLTPSLALFLERFDAADLGLVYILLAIPLILVSTVYIRLGRVLGLRSLIIANFGFVAVLTVVIRFVLNLDAAWPALLPSAWFFIVFTLTSTAFGAAANRVLDIRQGKRLIPLATTGEVVAFFMGGVLTPWIVAAIGTANLLFLSAGAAVLSGLMFLQLTRTYAHRFTPALRENRRRPADAPTINWSSAYLRLMVGYFAISALVFVLVDNAFNDVAERRYADTAELAAFFGTYSAIAAIANLVFKSYVSGRVVGRFGVTGVLVGFPLAIAIGAVLVATGGFLIPALGLIFWFTTMTRLLNKVFLSAQYATFPTLYQPLGNKGPAVHTTLEGVVEAGAMGLAGLLLIGGHALFDISALELSFLLIGVCAGWIWVAAALGREYTNVLGQALERRRIGPASLSMTDATSLDLVMREIESPYPENCLYALDLLAESQPDSLEKILIGMLDHPSDDIRLEVLRRIEKHRFAEAFPSVRALAEHPDASSLVRGAASRVRWVLSDDDLAEGVRAFSHPDVDVRIGTMVGMLRSGSVEGIVYSGHCLLDNLRSTDVDERVFAANVIGEAGLPSFYKQSMELLQDQDPRAQRAIIRNAPKIGHPDLWPAIVDALANPGLAAAASEALVTAGDVAVPSLAGALQSDRTLPGSRLAILRILGLIRSEAATAELLPALEAKDPDQRHAALMGLGNRGFRAEDSDVPWLKSLLKQEGDNAAYRFASIANFARNPAARLLKDSLMNEIAGIRHRIFLMLSFIYADSDVTTAWDNYASGDRDKRAYALERIENVVSGDLKAMVFPVIEDIPDDERLDRLSVLHEVRLLGEAARTKQIQSWKEYGITEWTAHCARHITKESGPEGPNGEDLVRQTIRLKSVDIFAQVPEHVLSGIVPKLRRVDLGENECVFSKGDIGDCLYIVLSGRVRMHEGSRTIAEVGQDRVFGEMTVLQSAPRTASATTSAPTSLLLFDQDTLYQLISEQVELAQSLIRIIIDRLRQNQAMRAGAGT